ncbi:MAG: tol-pal system-associated acyl-CoA thioesterase [Alphaproteobacteria bacterium]|nr:tol-pal system-associated acyl-CoA thioesterase [Alphaproteobacteria bacterium]
MIKTYAVRVFYEDTDFSGHVYHANYLKYCERARSDYLRVVGIDQNAMFAQGLAFVVRRMDCEFLRPARFEDELTVETRLLEMGGARFELAQAVKRGEEPIFSASVTVAIIDAQGKPKRIPHEFAQKFQR